MTGGRIFHEDHLRSQDVTQFFESAQRLCDVIDEVGNLTEVAFLKQMQLLLPLAYANAQSLELPWHYEDDDDGDQVTDSLPDTPQVAVEWSMRMAAFPRIGPNGYLDWWEQLRHDIGLRLSWHRRFHFVYDPVSPNDREVIDADLADCIADIYIELKTGLLLFEKGTVECQAEAVGQWKFGAEGGWGTHVAEVLLPIHHLMHTHYDEDDEAFDI